MRKTQVVPLTRTHRLGNWGCILIHQRRPWNEVIACTIYVVIYSKIYELHYAALVVLHKAYTVCNQIDQCLFFIVWYMETYVCVQVCDDVRINKARPVCVWTFPVDPLAYAEFQRTHSLTHWTHISKFWREGSGERKRVSWCAWAPGMAVYG